MGPVLALCLDTYRLLCCWLGIEQLNHNTRRKPDPNRSRPGVKGTELGIKKRPALRKQSGHGTRGHKETVNMEKSTASKAIFLLEGRRLTLPDLLSELASRVAGRKAVLGVRHG